MREAASYKPPSHQLRAETVWAQRCPSYRLLASDSKSYWRDSDKRFRASAPPELSKQPTSSPRAIPPAMKLRRVGNTLIVTIPKRVAEAMGWSEGDELQVQVAGRDALRISKGG